MNTATISEVRIAGWLLDCGDILPRWYPTESAARKAAAGLALDPAAITVLPVRATTDRDVIR